MAIDTSTLVDYAWSDIARAAKTAMMTAAMGGNNLTINGRTIGRISISEARTLYGMALEMIDAENAGAEGGGNILARFGDPE